MPIVLNKSPLIFLISYINSQKCRFLTKFMKIWWKLIIFKCCTKSKHLWRENIPVVFTKLRSFETKTLKMSSIGWTFLEGICLITYLNWLKWKKACLQTFVKIIIVGSKRYYTCLPFKEVCSRTVVIQYKIGQKQWTSFQIPDLHKCISITYSYTFHQ